MATVRIYFDDGINQYTLPYVQSVSDPQPGMKATVIEGKRASGSIVIPAGKKSIEISVKGKLIADGYEALTTLINEMRTKITTSQATLKLQHYSGGGWIDDWSFTVRRINEIIFEESLRTDFQDYSVAFLVTAY